MEKIVNPVIILAQHVKMEPMIAHHAPQDFICTKEDAGKTVPEGSSKT
jgi:hypothetical protein